MIEVGTTDYEHAAMLGLTLDERHEVLKGEWPWLEWLKREVKNSRLFVYKHRQVGSFVLAVWVFSPEESDKPVCEELEVFQGHPGEGMWPRGLKDPRVLLERLRPVDNPRGRIESRIRDQKSKDSARRESGLRERNDVVKYLKRKGLDQAAHELDTGQMPWHPPSQRTDQENAQVKELERAVKSI